MAHSKIRKVAILMFCLCSKLFCESFINVSSKLIKINDGEITFDVFIKNNTEDSIYFYPEGAKSFSFSENDTLFIIPNSDTNYYDGFISACPPELSNLECIEIKKGKEIQYRYKQKKNTIKNVSFLDFSKIELSLCIIDKNIKEIKSFDEYLECIKNNLLSDITVPIK